MTTIPDSIKAQLDADWTGAGGTEPAYHVSEDFRTNPPLGDDAVWIPTASLRTKDDPVNDTYVNRKHTIDLIVNTINSEDRMKELSDEVVRILNATAISGMTYQRIIDRRRNDGDYKGIWVYQEIITVHMIEHMVSSAAAYGAGATGDFIVTGDILSSTSYSHEEALMLGSANAAWVPCLLMGWDPDDKGEMTNLGTWTNIDATTCYITWTCPLPTNMGSLKLYITGTRVSLADADASDYMTSVKLEGEGTYGQTLLNSDTSANKTVGLQTDTFGAVDCSSYYSTRVRIQTVNTNAGDLDIQYVQVQAYYGT